MEIMETQWSPRIGWADLPAHAQSGVEEILGAPVIEAVGQQGGFSPGTADRVRTSTGRRAFVKAVNSALNSTTPDLHRKEAAITAALPDALPTPHLLGLFDDDDWVALVLTDIEGRHPHIPWRPDELNLVLDALALLARTPVPQALAHLPDLADELREDFGGWARIQAGPPTSLDPWIKENLGLFDALATQVIAQLEGTSLVHMDIRADNILLTADQRAFLVDWPWACRGPGWVDALTVLVNVRAFDPSFDVDSVLRSHPVFDRTSPDLVDGFLAGLGAYFIDVARRPAPPGLPTVRAFQQQQGDAVMGWLRERLGATPRL